jgi:hypothetical protein
MANAKAEPRCPICGDVWYRMSDNNYTCCIDCWRELRRHSEVDCDPCRKDGTKRCPNEKDD